MGGKLDIYNLGALGVVVDKSPIHELDGELLNGQNGQIDSVGNMGGIRCRDGMTKFNSVALAGAVKGFMPLPLPDPTTLTRHFYNPIDDNGGAASNNFRISSDGTTWVTENTVPVYPAQRSVFGSLGGAFYQPSAWPYCARLNNILYYPGNDYTPNGTPPTIHKYDGANDYILCTIPDNPASGAGTHPLGIVAIVNYSATQLLVSTYDDTTTQGRGRMFVLDVTTGVLTQLGPQTDMTGGIAIPIVFGGKIWWLSIHNGGGVAAKSFWARPVDTAWTQDSASATGNTATGYCIGGTVFLGALFFGTSADVGANALIRKRTASGVYSTARTSASTTLGNNYSGFIVSQDGLTMFVFEDLHDITTSGTNTAGHQRVLSTTDGSTFNTDLDVGNTLNNNYVDNGAPVLDTNGDIYWPFVSDTGRVGKTLKRTPGGVWTIVDGNNNHLSDGFPMRGPIQWIKF